MKEIDKVINKCEITVVEDDAEKTIPVDTGKFPYQKNWLGKKIGDTIFKSSGKKCQIIKIEAEPGPKPYPQPPKKAPLPALTKIEVERKYAVNSGFYTRGINVTSKNIVLISVVKENNDGFVYHDCWVDEGVYSYSGEGKKGDQKFEKGNLALKNAGITGKDIYLLVKFSTDEYYDKGKFGLIDYRFEIEKDADGNPRKEIKFILRRDD